MLQRKSDTSSLVLPETVAGYHLQHTGTMRLPVLVFVLGGYSVFCSSIKNIRIYGRRRKREMRSCLWRTHLLWI